ASIGGPGALAQILRGLPANFPTPIALVQHMADGFTTAFTRWLGQELALRVREAEEGMELEPGTAYVAPDDHHLRIRDGRVSLGTDEPQHGFRPSVSALFHSAAACYGARSVGVLLTGMGMDGADGLAAIRQAGGLTIAQDEATSAVFGMPRAAIEIGAAERVLPLGAISDAIREALRGCRSRTSTSPWWRASFGSASASRCARRATTFCGRRWSTGCASRPIGTSAATFACSRRKRKNSSASCPWSPSERPPSFAIPVSSAPWPRSCPASSRRRGTRTAGWPSGRRAAP